MKSAHEITGGHEGAWSRFEVLCRERYSADLYEPDQLGGAVSGIFGADPGTDLVRVAFTPEGHSPLRFRDSPHHAVLLQRVQEAFGSRALKHVDASDEELSDFRSYRVRAAGQQQFFEAFVRDLPAALRARFPLRVPDGSRRIELESVEIAWPSADSIKVSSRCVVYSRVTLYEGDRPGAEEEIALFNFYAPLKGTGRVREPGRKLGRPFDEIRFVFERGVPFLLSEATERLVAGTSASSLSELLLGTDDA